MTMQHVLFAVLSCFPGIALAGATMTGWISDPALPEVSGMAASRAHPGNYWVENDSGNPPAIYAVTPGGSLRATLSIDGVPNIDWEDLASFDRDGHHYILIADTGDNGGIRKTLALHVVEEPAMLHDGHARPAWSIRFRWPDGARDCEAVAVDVRSDSILLVSKKHVPAELFRLPLHPATQDVLTAQFLGHLSGIEQPSAEEIELAPHYAKYLAQVTAADIAPDGHHLAVLTYSRIYVYRRTAGENWAQSVAQAPEPLSFGWLPQAEALAYAPDGRSLYVSGEHLPAPIMQVDVSASH